LFHTKGEGASGSFKLPFQVKAAAGAKETYASKKEEANKVLP